MNGPLFGGFLLAALAIQLIPGPGLLFIVANGIVGGAKAGVAGAGRGRVGHGGAHDRGRLSYPVLAGVRAGRDEQPG